MRMNDSFQKPFVIFLQNANVFFRRLNRLLNYPTLAVPSYVHNESVKMFILLSIFLF